MRFLIYTHSVVSDWNHGNAHFLRGIMRELVRAGHQATALEPADGWSRQHLLAEQGPGAVAAFEIAFPELSVQTYDADFDHEAALADADVVLVHEWTDPAIVAQVGRARREGGDFTLLFHDTHHRAVSAEGEISALDLSDYDAVLAFGATLKQRYERAGWGPQVFVWHEAADTALFHPLDPPEHRDDLIWIGNWGDGERADELDEFLLEPVRALGLSGTVRGVRYPDHARVAVELVGLNYGGWIANADVPVAFAAHRVTVHVPRQPYTLQLPGIPTIRMFEALACGIPLVSAPWQDCEDLFRPGTDFLFARDGADMQRKLNDVLNDADLAASLSRSGLDTIRSRHTCAHRVDELLAILGRIGSRKVLAQLDVAEAAL